MKGSHVFVAEPGQGARQRPRFGSGLRAKVSLATGVPSLVVIVLAITSLTDHLREASQLSALAEGIDFARDASTLAHELQKERGLTTGWLAGADNVSDLTQQRTATDEAWQRLPDFETDPSRLREDEHAPLDKLLIMQGLRQLPERRILVDHRSLSSDEAFVAYTALIEQLLTSVDTLPLHVAAPDLSDRMRAYAALTHVKEDAGQERALMTAALSRHTISELAAEKVLLLRTSQKYNLRLFEAFAPPGQRAYAAQKLSGEFIREFEQLRASVATADRKIGDVEPMRWFRIATERINLLRDVELGMAEELQAEVSRRQYHALVSVAAYGLVVLTVLTFLGLLVLWVDARVAGPMGRLVQAADRIANGEREVPIACVGEGETATLAQAMADMQNAIATSEQNLLQADAKLRLLADAAVDPIASVNEVGVIVYANEATARLLRTSHAALIGSNIGLFLSRELDGSPNRLLDYVDHTVPAPGFAGVETEGRRHDGTTVALEVSIGPLSDDESRSSTWIMRDISARLEATEQLRRTTIASERFVPKTLITLLGRTSVADLKLGDHVELEMAILFADLRGFTARSERMAPHEAFDFVNTYLGLLQPCIERHGGFIDKFLGDAILALFPTGPRDAGAAACAIQQTLRDHNVIGRGVDRREMSVGIGVHSGLVILGTVGTNDRMDGTVIGDTVNVAARIQDLTKDYDAPILISEAAAFGVGGVAGPVRFVDHVSVKGRRRMLSVYELLEADDYSQHQAKLATLDTYHEGVVHYLMGRVAEGAASLQHVLDVNPEDSSALLHLGRCLALRDGKRGQVDRDGDATEKWHTSVALWRTNETSTEHLEVLRLADDLVGTARSGAEADVIHGSLRVFRSTLATHFANEEGEMAQVGDPNYVAHKREHHAITAALEATQDVETRVTLTRDALVTRMIGKILVSLIDHIVSADAPAHRLTKHAA